eukprot:Colp12_sorted_trinity150504_noHs@2794
MAGPHLWLRVETKPNEHRVAITPNTARALMDAGFKITIEKSSERIFPDSEYEAIGCELAEALSWKSAPKDAFIVGLKELPENDESPLVHQHIYFGHAYKNQAGWSDLLTRFVRGGGSLLDMEFLADDKGRRVAAFGYYAGFAGAAVGVLAWIHNKLAPGVKMAKLHPYPNETQLIDAIKEKLPAAVAANGGAQPTVIVIGALGRCGSGAVDFCRAVGIPDSCISRWDMAETAKGGPFLEILTHDILVNCIYLSSPIPAFLTQDLLDGEGRRLSVVTDVSCDTSNPHNPLPFYKSITTFDEPLLRVPTKTQPPVDVVAIDHLPTLLPRESSERYAQDLLPTMLELKNISTNPVWQRALKLFHDKSAGLQ